MNKLGQTVFVVDDDEAVRDALKVLLRSAGLQVEVFASSAAFLNSYTLDHAGCMVLDVRMPGMGGLALQDEMLRRRLGIPIIFMTGHADVVIVVAAMKKGAFDFMEKPLDSRRLITTVVEALNFDIAQRSQTARQEAQSNPNAARLATLTERERQILAQVLKAIPSRAIAEELKLSLKTVEFHRARMREKLGVTSLPELFRLFSDKH